VSNIPEARRILIEALEDETPHEHIREALKLLDRKQPAFRAARSIKALTDAQKAEARRLRADGMPVNSIARKLGTNHGRVSEDCAPEAL